MILRDSFALVVAADSDVGRDILKLSLLEILIHFFPVVGIVSLERFLPKFKLGALNPGVFFPDIVFRGFGASGLQMGTGRKEGLSSG